MYSRCVQSFSLGWNSRKYNVCNIAPRCACIFPDIGLFFAGGGDRRTEKFIGKIFHAWKLLLLHLLLYLYNFFFETIFVADVIAPKSDIVYELRNIFSLGAIKTCLKWSTTLYGSAQWFLVALLEAYIILYILYKVGLGELLEKYSLTISILLFFVHIPIRILIVKLGITSVWGMDTGQTAIVRNTLFDALPFMLLGVWLKGNKEKIKLHNYQLIFIAMTGIVVSVFESYITEWFVRPYKIGCVLYVGTIVADLALFIYAINNGSKAGRGFWEYIGEHLSMTIYFIHPLVGKYIRMLIGENVIQESIIYRSSYPIIVVFMSISIAHIVKKITNYSADAKQKAIVGAANVVVSDTRNTAIFILCSFILLFSMLS